jgi:lysyl-tRNA synthetase class 2
MVRPFPIDRRRAMADSIRDVRLKKLEEIRAQGENPYPDRFARTHTVAEARAEGSKLGLEAGAATPPGAPLLRLCGRLMAFRDMGKLTFGSIHDFSGKIQIALNQATLGAQGYAKFLKRFDVGDFIGVAGRLFMTRRGELTLDVAEYELLGKALRPLPEKWHGLQDQELRWRHRYLDLVMNEATRERFKLRTRLVRVMREFLDASAFEEVETPVLMPHASGAMARPFAAHHNALDLEVYLRIAPETYLKRLIVGGYDRVYEFARCFRNEGMDPSHLQDFTMLEWYAAYWNFIDNMDFTEKLVKHTLERVAGSLRVDFGGKATDFAGAWPRKPLREMILEDAAIDIDAFSTADALRAAIQQRGIRLELKPGEWERLSRGSLIDQLYKKVSRPKIQDPVFVTSHPADLSPLARRNDRNPAQVDRFQLVVHGWEIVNAYSELVDPIDQRRRLEEQAAARQGGDEEAMVMEEDYLVAMEYGMPPISGFGMGIDRFAALLSGQENLRDVVLFPLMRPLESYELPGETAGEPAAAAPAPPQEKAKAKRLPPGGPVSGGAPGVG